MLIILGGKALLDTTERERERDGIEHDLSLWRPSARNATGILTDFLVKNFIMAEEDCHVSSAPCLVDKGSHGQTWTIKAVR